MYANKEADEVLAKAIENAKEKILIYSPRIDEKHAGVLIRKAFEGVKVYIITGDLKDNKGGLLLASATARAPAAVAKRNPAVLMVPPAAIADADLYVVDGKAWVGFPNLTISDVYYDYALAEVDAGKAEGKFMELWTELDDFLREEEEFEKRFGKRRPRGRRWSWHVRI